MLSDNEPQQMIQTWQMRPNVVTPGAAVLTLPEIKSHLRITDAAEDTYLTTLGLVAQSLAETYTGLYFSTTIMQAKADNPSAVQQWWSGVVQAPAVAMFGSPRGLLLPGLPLQTVASFKFVDLAGTETAFASTDYFWDGLDKNRPGRIVLRYFTVYPGVPQEILSLVVDYTVGYADGTLPPELKQALLMLVNFLYDNRGECSDAGEGVIKLSGAKVLLDLKRVVRI